MSGGPHFTGVSQKEQSTLIQQRASQFSTGKQQQRESSFDFEEELVHNFKEKLEESSLSRDEEKEKYGVTREELADFQSSQLHVEAQRRGQEQLGINLNIQPNYQEQPSQLEIKESSTTPSSQKSAQASKELQQAKVAPWMLELLKQNGINKPLVGLHDPRLAQPETHLLSPWQTAQIGESRQCFCHHPPALQRYENSGGNISLESRVGESFFMLFQDSEGISTKSSQ